MEYINKVNAKANISKTQIYQKVKKPLLERQRRARINKCLDTLKALVADLQGDDAILRMDKAEMLEAAVVFVRREQKASVNQKSQTTPQQSFQHGYMNAVNEVSRVMAATPGMNVELGKSVMTHLGRIYKNMEHFNTAHEAHLQSEIMQPLTVSCAAPLSPASSGYHSDCESPTASPLPIEDNLWRPW